MPYLSADGAAAQMYDVPHVSSGSDVSSSTMPLSYKDWLMQNPQYMNLTAGNGSVPAYKKYLEGFANSNSSLTGTTGGDTTGYNGFDPTGYDQAIWEYNHQRELLAEQRAFNSAEAEKDREFQREMSNTAYQRAVKDLEAAGLNKWLAVTGGNGASASTPSGSSATSSAGDASTPNPKIYIEMIKALASMMNSALKLI